MKATDFTEQQQEDGRECKLVATGHRLTIINENGQWLQNFNIHKNTNKNRLWTRIELYCQREGLILTNVNWGRQEIQT